MKSGLVVTACSCLKALQWTVDSYDGFQPPKDVTVILFLWTGGAWPDGVATGGDAALKPVSYWLYTIAIQSYQIPLK